MVSSSLNILLGISGGIAAYKSLFLIRLLIKNGFNVKVIITENGKQFVTPVTIEALTGHPLYDELYRRRESFSHISLREWADVTIIAPATANVIAKIALGFADDLFTATMMSCAGLKIICPAMNTAMYDAVPVQKNLKTLKDSHWDILGPAGGELACGAVGSGRMVEPEEIFSYLLSKIDQNREFSKIVISAGATREPIDQVRFISNHSTGKMGIAIAQAATKYFQEVVLIHGNITESIPVGVKAIPGLTVDEMYARIKEELQDATVLVMTAAVSDFTPVTVNDGKIKKATKQTMQLDLKPTVDILKETISLREKRVYSVGFAMETDNLLQNGLNKLKDKKLDAILVNPLLEKDAGFGSNTNRIIYLSNDENENWPLMSKVAIGEKLLKKIISKLNKE